jgi:hypothetical protein
MARAIEIMDTAKLITRAVTLILSPVESVVEPADISKI